MPRAPVGRSTPGRSGGLALALSLGLHALVLTVFHCLPAAGLPVDRSPPLLTVVAVSDDDADAPGPAAHPRQQGSVPLAEPEPPPAPIQPIQVSEIPPPGPAPTPVAPAASSDPGGATPGTDTFPGGGVPGTMPGNTGPVFFQVAARGSSVVYVLDCSASMGVSGSFADARRELLASLGRLPESARFQVICYNRDAAALNIGGYTDLVPATAENRRAAGQVLEGVRPAGSTRHLEALRQALALEPDVIFWVTDAADLSIEQVRTVTAWNHGRTAIHAIELSGRDPDGPDTPLAQLARYNRGTYRVVAPAGGE